MLGSPIANNISKNVSDVIANSVNQKELYLHSMTVEGANNLTATFPDLTYFNKLKVVLSLAEANTGAMDLNINGLGAKGMKKIDGQGEKQDLEEGDLFAGNITMWEYDNTDFVLIGALTQADLNTIRGITLTAGNGLTGGGNLTENRTFTLGTPSNITGETTNSVSSNSHTHAVVLTKDNVGLNNVDNVKQVPETREVAAGDGLTGGGNLSDDITVTMGEPSNITGSSINLVTAGSHAHAFVQDENNRLVTDAEKATWNAKWDYDEQEVGTYLPVGSIIMWGGAFANIPLGWNLCDGENGTPNLTDRFILATNTEGETGDTGGTNTVTLTTAQLPEHTHTANTNETGAHTHTVSALGSGSRIVSSDPGGFVATAVEAQTTNSNGDHTHAVTVNNTGDGEAHENRPAFYKLAFIMKTE